MIYIEPEHKLTVVFTRTKERNDIDTFVKIIEKCTKEAKKSGFKSLFTTEERDVIKALNENLTGQ